MSDSDRLALWRNTTRILCVRLDSMGDVLMMTPAMRALNNSASPRHLTLLSSSSGIAVAPFINEVNDVIEYSAPWMKHGEPQNTESDLQAIALLRARRFDAAVIFTSYSQSPLPAAMHCYLAGIPLRLAHCHENPYRLLTDWIRDPEPQQRVRHEVRRQLDLVSALGFYADDERLSMQVPPHDIESAQRHLNQLDIDPRRGWLLLHPGASAPSRRYPVAHWAQVVRQLTSMHMQIVLSGSASELPTIDEIKRLASTPSVAVASGIGLGEFAALVSGASLLISNNTGPVHIAAAVGTPVVDLYALTNPQHTPWKVPCRVLFEDVSCGFCYKSECPQQHQHCLSKVSPERVIEAAMALLNEENKENSLNR